MNKFFLNLIYRNEKEIYSTNHKTQSNIKNIFIKAPLEMI